MDLVLQSRMLRENAVVQIGEPSRQKFAESRSGIRFDVD
jgi:hypothetical protein